MGAPQYEQAGADIGGTGTPNTIPRWTGASTLGDSGITDNGSTVSFVGRNITAPSTAGGASYVLAPTSGQVFGQTVGGSVWYLGRTTAAGAAVQPDICVNASGNVGIGTASPGYRADVQDTQNGTAALRVRNLSSGASAYTIVYLGTDTNAADAGILRSGSANAGYNGANGLTIWTSAAHDIGLVTNNVLRMRISNAGTQSQSQVAIGTSSFTSGRALTTVADLDVFGVRVGRGGGDVSGNTCIGAGAMAATATSADNTACGKNALAAVASGARNTAIGSGAGSTTTIGSDCVFIGQAAVASSASVSNEIVIGSGATGLGADTALIGNASTVSIHLDAKFVRLVDSYTVGTLPAAGTAGRIARVTDGDAALAWGATVVNTGAGATPYLVWDNGTNWTVFGK